ncbi:MAG: hypothetical protein ACHQ3O_13665 [Candidatus Limnocylindria bacterium]
MARSRRDRVARPARYPRFQRLDGRHPLQRRAPHATVCYRARRRRDGEVAYFNFALAKEMGLVPEGHAERLNAALSRAILETFALAIINEYDLRRGTRFARRDLKPGSYMATRYLQLQHPDRSGRTSGDGRSIWNGTVTHRGVTWDVSSCGTGVTRLCPATAQTGRFYKSGSRVASYGCGTAALAEGLAAALLSETFHRNGIATERVLAVIALPGGFAINVRAGRNLLRPSHFLAHSKQNDLATLRGVADCFIARQMRNGSWPRIRGTAARYRHLAEEAARTFAQIAATFESEYVFCWLAWDGDNILADGGIVDYGSVRQFGLYHREYRFDDVDRLSTTLPEQRRQARAIVQNFAQIRDFLIRGRKAPLSSYRRDPVLRRFDAEFEAATRRLLLRRIGLPAEIAAPLLERERALIERFRRAHAYFERARSARGPQMVPDGLSWNAIFSSRDLLRELPARYRAAAAPIPAEELLAIAASSYASRADRILTPQRRRMAGELQRAYLALLAAGARAGRVPLASLLDRVARRSAVINRWDRITGDAVEYAAARLMRSRRSLGHDALHGVIGGLVGHQDRRVPPAALAREPRPGSPAAQRVLGALLDVVAEYRHGL